MKSILFALAASSALLAFQAKAGDGPALDVTVENDAETGFDVTLKLNFPKPGLQPMAAQAVVPQGFAREQQSGCLYLQSAITEAAEAAWSGGCDAAGYATGQGVMRYAYPAGYTGYMRRVFEGGMLNGMAEGPGVVVYENGNRLEATFRYDLAEGQGRLLWATGARYEGEFRNGKRTGKGRETSPDGRIYEGDVVDGEFQGVGILTWPDGRRYTGHFVDGNLNGQGTFIKPGDHMIEGLFKDGYATGRGRVKMADGRCFIGIARDGKFRPGDEKNQPCS